MNLAQVETSLVLAGELHFGRTAERLLISPPIGSRYPLVTSPLPPRRDFRAQRQAPVKRVLRAAQAPPGTVDTCDQGLPERRYREPDARRIAGQTPGPGLPTW